MNVQGKIVGFRRWDISAELKLESTGVHSEWCPGVNHAECKSSDHAAPASDCQCGLYALYDLDENWGGEVAGVVTAWGEVEAHPNGFRAEHAEVVLLGLPEDERGKLLARELAQRYGVPLVPAAQLGELAIEYGQPLPVEHRPVDEPDVGHGVAAPGGSVGVAGGFTIGPPPSPKKRRIPRTWLSKNPTVALTNANMNGGSIFVRPIWPSRNDEASITLDGGFYSNCDFTCMGPVLGSKWIAAILASLFTAGLGIGWLT